MPRKTIKVHPAPSHLTQSVHLNPINRHLPLLLIPAQRTPQHAAFQTLSTTATALLLLTHNHIGELASQLNVIIRKLSNLGFVQTEFLFVFADAEGQAWDEVHEEEDDACAKEGVGEAGDAVGKLVGELDPVVVEPAAGDFGEAVEVGYVVAVCTLGKLKVERMWGEKGDSRSEEGSQQVPHDTTNAMLAEDIKGVIHTDHILQLRRIITRNCAHDAEDDCRPSRNEAGCRRDSDET
jgi:hypothetical protein